MFSIPIITNSSKRRRRKYPKGRHHFSVEVRFILDTFLVIFLWMTFLRYLPPQVMLWIEWFNGNQLFRLALIIAGVVLILLNMRGKRKSRTVLAVLATVVLMGEAFYYIPLRNTARVVPAQNRLRVLTLNSEQQPPDTILSYLVREDVDLACLEEVHLYKQAKLIKEAKKLGYNGHYQHLRRDAGMGIVLLSKGPILEVDSISAQSFRWDWRVFMVVKTRIKDKEVNVIGVQLESVDRKRDLAGVVKSWSYRLTQSETVAQVVKKRDGPFLVLGDFNATPTDRSIMPIRRLLKDSWLSAGRWLGGTWNSKHPLFRIDQILYRGFPGVENAKRIPLVESDHLAYQVDLLLTPEK